MLRCRKIRLTLYEYRRMHIGLFLPRVPMQSLSAYHIALGTFPLPDSRFSAIHVDHVGGIPSSKGYGHISTITNRFTRSPEAVPIEDIARDSPQQWTVYVLLGVGTAIKKTLFVRQLTWPTAHHCFYLYTSCSFRSFKMTFPCQVRLP